MPVWLADPSLYRWAHTITPVDVFLFLFAVAVFVLLFRCND
jgi:hypothetical protein